MAHIRLRYFALMRDEAGCGEETLDTTAADTGALYDQLASRHGFTLTRSQLRVAVNAEFADWSRPLADGDEVVFIPPVAGG